MYTCEYIYILGLINYYFILLNLALANPHTELAMARLSSPANTTTISNNSIPRVTTLQPTAPPPSPFHPSLKIQTVRAKTRGKHIILPLNSREPKHGDLPETSSITTYPLDIFTPPPLFPMPLSLGPPSLEPTTDGFQIFLS